MELKQYRQKIDKLKTVREMAEKQKANLEASISKAESRLNNLELALVFLQQVAKDTQENLKIHITDIVQMALDTCFPGEYKFAIEFEIRRNRTEADLWFIKNGVRIDPMYGTGGGVVDIAAFALRIAAWTLGKTDNVIVFDEPFRFLSKDLHPRAGEILAQISKRLKLQLILVTHSQDLIDAADRVFKVKLEGDKSKVRVVNAGN